MLVAESDGISAASGQDASVNESGATLRGWDNRTPRCRFSALGGMLVRVPDLVIGVGLPNNDRVWHNCAHVE